MLITWVLDFFENFSFDLYIPLYCQANFSCLLIQPNHALGMASYAWDAITDYGRFWVFPISDYIQGSTEDSVSIFIRQKVSLQPIGQVKDELTAGVLKRNRLTPRVIFKNLLTILIQ